MRIDVVRIESNRKVPQTSLLSLGVLDMDGGLANVNHGGKVLNLYFRLVAVVLAMINKVSDLRVPRKS